MKKACFFEPLPNGNVKCGLCAHRCTIGVGRRGLCGVRENQDGVLMSLVYGSVCSTQVDPIEKKPLFHFKPGSRTFSIASVGCNFRCLHCQNSSISQYPREHEGAVIGYPVSAESIVAAAIAERCESISFTYTEPTIFFEFAQDCAILAAEKGLKNVFVSNGFMTPESAEVIIPYLHADNIDLKGDAGFYKEICGAEVEPVKDTIRLMKEGGVWVEVTTLVIPGLNDSEQVLRGIAEFIVSVDASIPWHVSRFYGTYKMTDRPGTPAETLKRACEIGYESGLKFVYQGNLPGMGGENTSCSTCKKLLIKRDGFTVISNAIKNGNCPACGTAVAGVW
ncbi:MAG: AmmeMemoRadiSam system radical SAM enzyme [Nitrospirae bacterium]|nr:AmmeMemoRadiSam system radical SAM enzyme [Nitrospirota bacterium]